MNTKQYDLISFSWGRTQETNTNSDPDIRITYHEPTMPGDCHYIDGLDVYTNILTRHFEFKRLVFKPKDTYSK